MTAPGDGASASVMTLRPVAGDVRAARAFTVTQVSALAGDDEAGDDFLTAAATITSDLVTNALNAGAQLIRLTVDVRSACVLISVTDDAGGEVATAAHDPLALSGRGLRMVETLSSRWGVTPDPDGKRVWAELEFPRAAAPGDPTREPT